MAKFTLGADGSTPPFLLLGRGTLCLDIGGTFSATCTIYTKSSAGTSLAPVDADGSGEASFTAPSGVLEIVNPKGEYLFTVSGYSSGSVACEAYSHDALIYFPDADASGNGATFEDLPTADPEVSGALWNNSGVVTTSAG